MLTYHHLPVDVDRDDDVLEEDVEEGGRTWLDALLPPPPLPPLLTPRAIRSPGEGWRCEDDDDFFPEFPTPPLLSFPLSILDD